MKKNILKATLVAAFGLIAGFNVYNSQKSDVMSDLALANVEALASGEEGIGKGLLYGTEPDENREGRFDLRIDREEIHENKIVCSNTMQITLDDDFNVPDSKADIETIVKERGSVHIDTVKAVGDRAEVTGGMDFAVLYAGSESGEKSVLPVKMTGTMNIGEVVNLSGDCENTYVSCQAKLEDITVKMIHSRKLSVKAIISLTVVCEEIHDTPIGCGLLEMQDEDKLQLKTTDVEYSQLAVTMRDNLRIRESFLIPAGKPEVAELLWEDVDVRSFTTRLNDDGMEIAGEMNVFVMYSSTEENSMAQLYETTQNFSGKLDVAGEAS